MVLESFRTLRLAGYGLALAALGLAAPAAGLPVPLSEADPVVDEAAVRTFLIASPISSSSVEEPLLGYIWQPTGTGPYATIDRARFRQLTAPCVIRRIGHSIILISGRGPARTEYNGVDVTWACAGPAAAAPRLSGNFWIDHGRIWSVSLRPERRTETH